ALTGGAELRRAVVGEADDGFLESVVEAVRLDGETQIDKAVFAGFQRIGSLDRAVGLDDSDPAWPTAKVVGTERRSQDQVHDVAEKADFVGRIVQRPPEVEQLDHPAGQRSLVEPRRTVVRAVRKIEVIPGDPEVAPEVPHLARRDLWVRNGENRAEDLGAELV